MQLSDPQPSHTYSLVLSILSTNPIILPRDRQTSSSITKRLGKPIPKAQVMRFLKSKEYSDAKDFAGECESFVVVAKGQSKYGIRVDYILASSDSYSVLSSKGTSDHLIVKVDVVKTGSINIEEQPPIRQKQQRVMYNNSSLTKAWWRTHYYKA